MTAVVTGGNGAASEFGSRSSLQSRLLPFAPYVIVSAVHVWLRFADHPASGPTKLALMPLLAVAVWWATARIRPWPGAAVGMLTLGIVLSWLGDGSSTFFPMFENEVPMMILCFGLAHVVYVLLMWRGRGIAQRGFPKWSLAYIAAYIALMAVLVQHTGSLTVPVLCYGALLVATAAFASRCGPVVALGGLFFLVSDAILSFRIFAPETMPDWTSGAVMLTYTLGQGLIAYGIVQALRLRSAAR
ncbi:hypothetical protein ACI1US_02301 [Leucobacter sp. BZR 635]